MALHDFSKKLKNETAETIKRVGTYDFRDKGPSDFMHLDDLINEFSNLPLAEQTKISKDLMKDELTNIVFSKMLEYSDERGKINPSNLREIIFSGNECLQEPFNIDFLNNTAKYQSWIKKEK